ncbi:hypothetical protein MKZ38_004712 [Zalerion maritima]|uniref:Gfd2/YDR514C-like C-terminal domain-containing protein n=1 Tax=Zalerion maritima TaxID=339359 RepID=A0AAD5RM71_9PEZI|nr:hypothetical protein MKZ38_004712 [Zalerion maritima]
MSNPRKIYYDKLRADGLTEQEIKKKELVPVVPNEDKYGDLTEERKAEFLDRFIATAKGPDQPTRYESDGSVDSECNLNVISKDVPDAGTSKAVESMRKLTVQVNEIYNNLNRGDGDPEETSLFCPWYMVYKYEQQFIGVNSRRKVKRHFTQENILNTRVWDFFYVHSPYNNKEYLLIPTSQFQCFLKELNAKYTLDLSIPDGKAEDLFQFHFPKEETPSPRFLGRTTKVADYKLLRDNIPVRHEEESTISEAIKDLFNLLSKASNTKYSHMCKKKRKGPTAPDRRKNWGRTTKRVQRYLGLRKQAPPEMSEGGLDVYQAALRQMKLDVRVEVDVNKPVPFEPEGNVVFVSIDLEWHEHNNAAITEVGIAVLDTKDIASVPPGEHATNWHQLIKARHIRLKDYLGHRNHRYIKGHPDMFNFGQSEICDVEETCRQLIALFESYPPGNSDIVLVGHDFDSDVKSLLRLGFNVYAIPNLREIVDSKGTHCHLVNADNGVSVRSSLDHFNLPYKYLHNAGNDAVYTLHVVLATVLQKKFVSLEHRSGRNDDPGLLGEGWSSNEDDDGGNAPQLANCNRNKAIRKPRPKRQSANLQTTQSSAKAGSQGSVSSNTPAASKAWGDVPDGW